MRRWHCNGKVGLPVTCWLPFELKIHKLVLVLDFASPLLIFKESVLLIQIVHILTLHTKLRWNLPPWGTDSLSVFRKFLLSPRSTALFIGQHTGMGGQIYSRSSPSQVSQQSQITITVQQKQKPQRRQVPYNGPPFHLHHSKRLQEQRPIPRQAPLLQQRGQSATLRSQARRNSGSRRRPETKSASVQRHHVLDLPGLSSCQCQFRQRLPSRVQDWGVSGGLGPQCLARRFGG